MKGRRTRTRAEGERVDVRLFGPDGKWRPSMDRVVDELAAIDADGLDVRIAQAARPGRRPPTQTPGRELMSRFVRYPVQAARESGDVFHVTDHSYAHLLAVLPRARTLVTCHDLIPLRNREMDLGFTLSPRAVAQYRFSVAFLRRAKLISTISAATRDDVVRYLGIDPARIRVVPLGVSPEFRPLDPTRRASLRRRHGFDGRFAVVQIGTTPYKDLPTVARTLALVRAAGIDAVVAQVGGHPWDGEAERVARELDVWDHIRPAGPLSDPELADLFGAADALLFPSLWEGFGLPPLEALACGLPVVCSDVPALSEVVGDAALMAAPRDAAAFAAHLARLATDPAEAGRLRERGLARAAHLTWERTQDAYAELYRELAA